MFTKENVLEVLENECYDILNDYEPEKVADLVMEFQKQIHDHVTGNMSRLVLGKKYVAKLDQFEFELLNVRKGYVKCTDEEENIGISRTLFFPLYSSSDDSLDGLTNFVEMINEAYYYCKNA